jgi:hypothetical protein
MRVIPAQVTASVRSLIDSALTKVFDHPYDVRNADDFERVMVEGAGLAPSMSLASVGAIAAVIARTTPWIERALPWARRSASASKMVPAARMVTYALPVAIQVGTAVRHGVRELQVLASYVIHLLREAGIEPERDLVTALSLSLALDPDRTPDLTLTPGRAGAALARQWIVRSLGRESTAVVRRRARADLAAIERLDLPALAKEWQPRRIEG